MSEDIEIAGLKVPKADWDATPESIQALVRVLGDRLTHVEERLNQSSQNSSKPPSSDGFGQAAKAKAKRQPRASSRRPQPRQMHRLVPSTDCVAVHEVSPPVCGVCGHGLSGMDEHPHRHQVTELPPMVPEVSEYRLHRLVCERCGARTQAELPAGVPASGYGERLSAVVALLSGPYRQSHRQVQSLMAELFDVSLSRGGVGRLRQEMNEALASVVREAHAYVQAQPVMHSDETSFAQGNRDGGNPARTKGWLWVLVTPLVSFFEVALSRSQATAKRLIGEDFEGIVNSDRYSAYGWLAAERWQVCWAHLKRDLTAMAERPGVAHDIGEGLLRRQRRLFRWWHQVRDGTLSREPFRVQVGYLREGFKAELTAAANLPIAPQEKTPLAKTVRTCRQLLKIEPALWTFVDVQGVEPTNNAAERALRPAVIWRRTSFGSQSLTGSQFVARMLTVTASLKAQNRSLLAFLSQAIEAARTGLPMPSVLPGTTMQDEPLISRDSTD